MIEQAFANDHKLSVGESFSVLTPAGKTADLTVKGIYEAPPFFKMLGEVTMPVKTFDSVFESPKNLYTFVNTEGGATPEAEQQLQNALAPFPSVKIDTQAGFTKKPAGVDQPVPEPR